MTARARRIVILGASGSGKTHFARRLSRELGIPHIELDSLYWGENWTPVGDGEFLRRVDRCLRRRAWIIEGDYDLGMDRILERADEVICFDFPLPIVLAQVTFRTLTRALLRVRLWSGNRESIRALGLSGESLLLWTLRSHKRRREQFRRMAGGRGALSVLRSRRQARDYLVRSCAR